MLQLSTSCRPIKCTVATVLEIQKAILAIICHGYSRVQLDMLSEHATEFICYDTRCYFNVRSKANMSQLNLPHGTDN